jgi:hypothetical protein
MENLPFSESDWESMRRRFQDSLMKNTELYKLAQNIDVTWPFRGKDETPMKYISYSLDELNMMPEFAGKPERIVLLHSIIAETLAFDDPFGEMADYVDSSSKKDDSAIKSLNKLEIPASFPIKLSNFSEETLAFCDGEEIKTIGELVSFSQNMAQSIVVGGEFRSFLNSLTHLDVHALKNFLPIREGKPGLFLVESLALIGKKSTASEAKTLLKVAGLSSDKPAWKQAKALGQFDEGNLIDQIEFTVEERGTFFLDHAQELKHAFKTSEQAFIRFFAPLNNPETENLAQAIAIVGFKLKDKNQSLFKRLFSR